MIIVIRGRRAKILIFFNNLRGISIAHINEIYYEDCCLEMVVRGNKRGYDSLLYIICKAAFWL